MKPNKKLIDAEVKSIKKLMEDIGIVNSGDLNNNNWSASYHLRKKEGLSPFIKDGYTISPLGNKETSYKNKMNAGFNLTKAIYMTQEQADELNEIGIQIRELISQYNVKLQQYAKE